MPIRSTPRAFLTTILAQQHLYRTLPTTLLVDARMLSVRADASVRGRIWQKQVYYCLCRSLFGLLICGTSEPYSYTPSRFIDICSYRPKHGGALDTNVVTGFKDAILTGPKKIDVDFAVRSEAKKNVIANEWERADAVLKRFE